MPGYPYPRFDRYPGGAVPQTKRTPEEQLKYLDSQGLVAKKERAKLLKRIASRPTEKQTKAMDSLVKDSEAQGAYKEKK